MKSPFSVRLFLVFVASFFMSLGVGTVSAAPAITGIPVIDAPKVLAWPIDTGLQTPNLNEPTANLLNDFHGELTQCEMVLSTAGNYHMALKDLWVHYLAQFPVNDPLKNWFYTTSPPVSKDQIAKSLVQFGNLNARCRPQVAVGPKALIDSLIAARFTTGSMTPIIKTFGNVLLVKKGNPKKIHSIWDLAKNKVKVATPNKTEGGAFNLYANSIYNIASLDPAPPSNMTADELFNEIFNNKKEGKWLTGVRIHHREVPWSIAFGEADVAVIFYHLALHAVKTFPDLFEIVPLGGTVENPQPLLGNDTEVLNAIRINGNWSMRQLEATEKLMFEFQSSEFTTVLQAHGLRRP